MSPAEAAEFADGDFPASILERDFSGRKKNNAMLGIDPYRGGGVRVNRRRLGLMPEGTEDDETPLRKQTITTRPARRGCRLRRYARLGMAMDVLELGPI